MLAELPSMLSGHLSKTSNLLQPQENKASFYLAHLAANLVSFFEGHNRKVKVTFVSGPAVYIQRAQGLSLEVCTLRDEKLSLYCVLPGSIEMVSKVLELQLKSFDPSECVGWKILVLAFFQLELPKTYDKNACVEKAKLYSCGDYSVGNYEYVENPKPTHHLYLAAFELDLNEGKIVPLN